MIIHDDEFAPAHVGPEAAGGIRDHERRGAERREQFDAARERLGRRSLVGMHAPLQHHDRHARDRAEDDSTRMAGGR